MAINQSTASPVDAGGTALFTLKFDSAAQEIFLTELSVWPNIKRAAKKAGVCKSTVYNHLRTSPDFRIAVDEALQCAGVTVRCAVTERSLLGPLPKGEEANPVTYDENGVPEMDARAVDLDAVKFLLTIHGNGVARRKAAVEKAEAVPEIASQEETDAWLREQLKAKLAGNRRQRRHEDKRRRATGKAAR